jgi:hypothetical protein
MAWIALAVMIACWSRAQTPGGGGTAGNGPSKTSNISEKADGGQYPTKDSPLPVSIIPSPEDATHEASREAAANKFNHDYLDSQIRLAVAAEKQSNAAWTAAVVVAIEAIIAIFALCFLMKTYMESRITARAAIRSAHAAKKAANAADLSAKASVGVSIATLLLSRLDFGETGAANLEAILQSPNIDVALRNYGNTFAVAKFQTVVIICAESLPETPEYKRIYPLPFAGMVVEKDMEWQLEVMDRPIFSIEDIEAIKAGKKFLWVYGFGTYQDFLGAPHERRFCQRLYITSVGHSFAEDRNTPKTYTESS